MICQEEMEPDRWVREQGQDEEWADALAQQQMHSLLSIESGASAAPDAEDCKAVDSVGLLRTRIVRLHRKKRFNSSVKRCRQGLIKSMVN